MMAGFSGLSLALSWHRRVALSWPLWNHNNAPSGSHKNSVCWYLYFSLLNSVIYDVGGLLVGEISQRVRPCRQLDIGKTPRGQIRNLV